MKDVRLLRKRYRQRKLEQPYQKRLALLEWRLGRIQTQLNLPPSTFIHWPPLMPFIGGLS